MVEIVRQVHAKRYLGGYRNKKTGVVYHNAVSQTMTMDNADFCKSQREVHFTQTINQHHINVDTTNEMSTQMTGVAVYVANLTDKCIMSRPYIDADMYKESINNKVSVCNICTMTGRF